MVMSEITITRVEYRMLIEQSVKLEQVKKIMSENDAYDSAKILKAILK